MTIVQAINDLIGIPIIDWTAEEVIEAVDIQAIVDQIIANVNVSLGILEACLDLEPTPPTPSPCEVTVDTITGFIDPLGFAYDNVTERMYVTNSGFTVNNTVSVIDTTTNTVIGSPIPVGFDPQLLAYDSFHQDIYVTSGGEENVYVIDTTTNTVIATIPVGFLTYSIAYDPLNHRMYVGDGDLRVL